MNATDLESMYIGRIKCQNSWLLLPAADAIDLVDDCLVLRSSFFTEFAFTRGFFLLGKGFLRFVSFGRIPPDSVSANHKGVIAFVGFVVLAAFIILVVLIAM